jgi:ABC-type transporter MlaC component
LAAFPFTRLRICDILAASVLSEAFMRTLAGVFVALAVLWLIPVGANATPLKPAEQFIQDSADRAVAILTDKSLTEADRRAKLWGFLSGILDLKRTALFVAGPAAKTASPDVLAAYIDAYSRFALANYISEVSGYNGEVIAVTGSVPRNDGDVIVNADVLDAHARPGAPPLAQVAFRVISADGKFAILDASVMGIWFTLAQHDEYAGFLAQNGGDLKALTARLNAKVEKLQSRAAPAGQ